MYVCSMQCTYMVYIYIAIAGHFQLVWTVNTLNNNKVARRRNRLYTPTLPFSLPYILKPNPIHARRCRMLASGHINVLYRIARGLLVQCAYTYTTMTIYKKKELKLLRCRRRCRSQSRCCIPVWLLNVDFSLYFLHRLSFWFIFRWRFMYYVLWSVDVGICRRKDIRIAFVESGS